MMYEKNGYLQDCILAENAVMMLSVRCAKAMCSATPCFSAGWVVTTLPLHPD